MASYERQTWVDLQTPLDAAHMNHIEEGIASIVGITSIKQTTTSTADGGNNVITATLDNGTTETFNIKNGSKGSTGSKGDTGAAGVGIKSVVQTTTSSADGGNNVITVTKTDGTTSTFVVKNGSKGSTGAAGAKGADGYSPVKGTDYWTPADQESIVQQVIAALGTPVFGRVDADNNIILSGELANGTYTFKYEDADGNLTEIGSLNWDNVLYTNQIPISTDTDGSIFNGTGYMEARRIGSSGTVGTLGNENASKAAFVTGFIPIKSGDVFRFKNCFICTQSVSDTSVYGIATWNLRIGYYGSSKEFKNSDTWNDIATGTYASGVVDSAGLCRELTFNEKIDSSGYKYVRFSLAPDDVANVADAVITINELIE